MTDLDRYHTTVRKIVTLLQEQKCEFKIFEHEAVRTSEEAAQARPEYTISQGAKALIVRVKMKKVPKKKFVQIVVPGDARFDTKKAREVLRAKDIRFATEEEVAEITDGVQPGGVPPFGNLFGIPVYIDTSLLEHTEIIFNAGDRRLSIALKIEDYMRVVAPTVASLV